MHNKIKKVIIVSLIILSGAFLQPLAKGQPIRETNIADSQTLYVKSDSSDYTSLETLYHKCKKYPAGKFFDMALAGYIKGINKSENTIDQKVLMFRKAMEIAGSVEQKKQILHELAENNTLHSLVFAAKFLDNSILLQDAAEAVTRIILTNKDLFGPVVKEIIEKVLNLDGGTITGLRTQALINHLSLLPVENGYVSLFNGKDFTGWKGLVGNPLTRPRKEPAKLAEEQIKADELMNLNWKVEDNKVFYVGEGYVGEGFDNLCTEKWYGDFELILDWRTVPNGDGGIYLRGTPQVQIWDPEIPRKKRGEITGSGALFNNQKGLNKPLVVADNPVYEWNTFRILMTGQSVTIYLNGQLVMDNVIMENFWDRKMPVSEMESIELQAHRTRVEYRDIYLREIPR